MKRPPLYTHTPPPLGDQGPRTVEVRTSSGRVDRFPRQRVGRMLDCAEAVRRTLPAGEVVVETISYPPRSNRKTRDTCRRAGLLCETHSSEMPLEAARCRARTLGQSRPPSRSTTVARVTEETLRQARQRVLRSLR